MLFKTFLISLLAPVALGLAVPGELVLDIPGKSQQIHMPRLTKSAAKRGDDHMNLPNVDLNRLDAPIIDEHVNLPNVDLNRLDAPIIDEHVNLPNVDLNRLDAPILDDESY